MGAIIIAAGGTGGHVYPALAVASELAVMRPGAEIAFIGSDRGPEARLVGQAGWEFHSVAAAPWRRSRPWTLFGSAAASLAGAARARKLFDSKKAGIVFSTGGYASAPTLLAAATRRIPIVLHEPNARPGAVTRIFGRMAERITVAHEAAGHAFPAPKVLVTGVPVRRSLVGMSRPEARRTLGLPGDGFTVLVLGGSQGAGGINDALARALPDLAAGGRNIVLVWLCGPANEGTIGPLAGTAGFPVRVIPYLDDMAAAYGAADLAVARAGASTVAELLAAGLPAILVPYPHAAGRHQELNARAVAAAGAACVIPEGELKGPVLARRVLELAGNPQAREAMAAAARGLARPDAAREVGTAVLDVLDHRPGGAAC